MAAQPCVYLGANGQLGLAGEGAPVCARHARGGDDIGLGAALNEADTDRRRTEQGMAPQLQLPGISGFQKINDSGHFVDGVFAEMGAGAVGGFSASLQPKPQAAFVGGDDLQAGRFADDGQVRLATAGGQRARTGLGVFLIHQPGENNFRRGGPASAAGQAVQGREHGGNRAFGVASAPAINAAIGGLRNKLLRRNSVHGIEMRSQQEPSFGFAPGRQSRQHIGSSRQNFLKTNIQTHPSRLGGNELRHPAFPGAWMVGGQKGRVDARQSDQFAQQLFGVRHLSGEFRGLWGKWKGPCSTGSIIPLTIHFPGQGQNRFKDLPGCSVQKGGVSRRRVITLAGFESLIFAGHGQFGCSGQ